MSKGLKFDDGKVQFTLLPWISIASIARVMMYGAKKYSPNNWQHVTPPSRYMDACFRHLTARCRGEILDSETKMPHLWHAGCNIVFLIWFESKNKLPRRII